MTDDLLVDDNWVPAACTLPTTEQPMRRAEFDDLFDEDVLSVNQLSPLQVRLELRPDAEVAARAASLAAKERAAARSSRLASPSPMARSR